MTTRPGARPAARPVATLSATPGATPRARPKAGSRAEDRDRVPRPMRAAPVAIALLASLAAGATTAEETIFKKVEADGSVTFTDQPLPDAEITEGSPISVVGADPSVAVTPTVAADPGATGSASRDTSAALLDRLEAPEQNATTDTPLAPPPERDAADALPGAEGVSDDPTPVEVATGDPVIARLSIAAPPDGSTVIDAGQTIGVMVVADPPLDGVGQRVQVEIAVDGTVVAAGPIGTLDVPMPERGEHELSARVYTMTGTKLAESEPSVLHVRKPARP